MITKYDLELNELMQDGNMHIVMFYGENCGPCKFTMPFYEETAQYFDGIVEVIKFHKIHAWENDETKQYLSDTFDVKGVPTFITFLDGAQVHRKVGGGKKEEMMKYVQDSVDMAFKNMGVRI
jgi:thiol-disulfide isomerase/thioredoxin